MLRYLNPQYITNKSPAIGFPDLIVRKPQGAQKGMVTCRLANGPSAKHLTWLPSLPEFRLLPASAMITKVLCWAHQSHDHFQRICLASSTRPFLLFHMQDAHIFANQPHRRIFSPNLARKPHFPTASKRGR
jgi:hypothetical protein